ncbi:hypothetical protein ACNKHU_26480 [Shigella flexneri]
MAKQHYLPDLSKEFSDATGSGPAIYVALSNTWTMFRELGVDAIWLTPFYVSPQVVTVTM